MPTQAQCIQTFSLVLQSALNHPFTLSSEKLSKRKLLCLS